MTAGPLKVERDSRAAAALDELLDRVVARANGRRVVLFVDEVTILARNLERRERGAGDNFLHVLRRFRQKHGTAVATVLSGSIGFHQVSPDAPSTVNDIRKIPVGVGKILDIYAHADSALSIDDAFMRLQSEGSPITERPELVALVERLELDHYLLRTGDRDRFASPLVQRAWRTMRR